MKMKKVPCAERNGRWCALTDVRDRYEHEYGVSESVRTVCGKSVSVPYIGKRAVPDCIDCAPILRVAIKALEKRA